MVGSYRQAELCIDQCLAFQIFVPPKQASMDNHRLFQKSCIARKKASVHRTFSAVVYTPRILAENVSLAWAAGGRYSRLDMRPETELEGARPTIGKLNLHVKLREIPESINLIVDSVQLAVIG